MMKKLIYFVFLTCLVLLPQQVVFQATIVSVKPIGSLEEEQAWVLVGDLFTDYTHEVLRDDVTLAQIEEAQVAVDSVPDTSSDKVQLQALIDKAHLLISNVKPIGRLEEEQAWVLVSSLFTDYTHEVLRDDVTLAQIEEAQVAVDNVPNTSSDKMQLQELLIKARQIFDARQKDAASLVSTGEYSAELIYSSLILILLLAISLLSRKFFMK